MGSVCFPMVDTDTGEQVSCNVSFEILAHAPGQATDRLREFNARREEFEEIASLKYDAGERPPYITSADR
jgi:hypothetical protein